MVRNYTIGQKVQLINKVSGSKSQVSRNILDIGCGTGEFLNASKQDGWIGWGIEPSEKAREYAVSNYGIAPFPTLWDLPSPSKKGENGELFSIITMWHVLEHIHQLDKTIEQINKILVEDGTLIIAVPNCNSFDAEKYGAQWAAYDVPRHIYHFTKKDIEKLFARFNFKLVEVLPMKFDSYYVSLLSETYKTGKPNLAVGFFSGLKSNLNAGKNNGYSSHIYILKKK